MDALMAYSRAYGPTALVSVWQIVLSAAAVAASMLAAREIGRRVAAARKRR
jgi:hypothetical protein